MRFLSVLLIIVPAVASLQASAGAAGPTEPLANDARAVLAEKCFACHGPDVQEADLRLDTRDGAIGRLDSGTQAIVPGDVDSSELLTRVTSTDESDRMPPEGEPLTAQEVTLLRNWIAASAPYPTHWAYAKLDPASPPPVGDDAWVASPIDRYVLAGLESRGIRPSPMADRYTLIMRLHDDLIGLPPSPAEVDRFVADQRPDAYERLVDSLLASPHFGERWGRHWLDKARYADSDGYEKDRPRPNAWRYRDWVIKAINRDLPLDQFTVEQLAGDLLPRGSDSQALATAFHRQTLTNTEGGVDQEEFRVDAVFDRTETTGTVWLGLTVGCARCHSHKYDAISQRDYYRLFAFFNNGDESMLELPTSATEWQRYLERAAAHRQRLAELEEQIAAAKQGTQASMNAWLEKLRQQLSSVEPLKQHPISVVSVTASEPDHQFAQLADGSFLVSGNTPQGPVDYTIVATAAEEMSVSGLRIDTLADESLPGRGPGRVAHGNFVLSELEVVADEQPLTMIAAEASFSQSKFSYSKAVDGKLDTGWAISPRMGEDHFGRYRFRKPLDLAADSVITLHLRQHHGSQHSLGRFRLSWVTGDDLDRLAPEPIRNIAALQDEELTGKQKRVLSDHFFRAEFAATKRLYEQLEALRSKAPAKPTMQVRVIKGRDEPRKTHVFDRGEFLSPAEVVEPAGLEVLPPIPDQGQTGLDRLDLARWLMDASNPLPPRVLANHLWSHLFGYGLVRTENDFGVRGERPTHPELLDWLAVEYRRSGWSRKRLIKTIVMSSTYRQASDHRSELVDVDPQNLLLARQNRFRVPAETVRDLCLAVSGLLSREVGGPSVYPPLPPDVAALSYANNFKWATSSGGDRYRRGMYTFFKRTAPHPNLTVFDCPDSNTTAVSRRISNTPLQALTLLNNEVYFEAACGLASRAMAMEEAGDRERVSRLLRLCLSRPPSAFEVDRFLQLFEHSHAWYAENPQDARQLVSHTGMTSDPAEAAAWISVSRIALNLDELITRE